jgi:hypothetical protein
LINTFPPALGADCIIGAFCVAGAVFIWTGAGAELALGALFKGAPTAISQRCPGNPCAGFKAIGSALGVLTLGAESLTVGAATVWGAGATVFMSTFPSPSLLLQAAANMVITNRLRILMILFLVKLMFRISYWL